MQCDLDRLNKWVQGRSLHLVLRDPRVQDPMFITLHVPGQPASTNRYMVANPGAICADITDLGTGTAIS